jgi:hypothetical protein
MQSKSGVAVTRNYLTDRLSKQKVALRLVGGLKYIAHTKPTIKKLGILPLPGLTDFFMIQFMHRFVQGLLPASFNYTWISNAVRRGEGGESAVLRNDGDLYIPPDRTTQTNSHPLTNFPQT